MFTNCTSVPKKNDVQCVCSEGYEMKYNYEGNLEERTIKNILLRETSFTCVPFISPKKSLSLANLLCVILCVCIDIHTNTHTDCMGHIYKIFQSFIRCL